MGYPMERIAVQAWWRVGRKRSEARREVEFPAVAVEEIAGPRTRKVDMDSWTCQSRSHILIAACRLR